MTFYSFDTSALLNGRRDLLPPEVFPSVWLKIESMISAGSVRAVDVVLIELSKRDDESHGWAKSQTQLFIPPEVDVQIATKEVLARHEKLMGVGGGRNGADPFVIGLAKARNGVVVTQETASGRIEKPRIPDVCAALGIPCVTLIGFVTEQGWSF